MIQALARLPAALVLGLIRFYRQSVSPVLPAFFGTGYGCRFVPSCAEYAAEAVQTHGAAVGTVLSLRRCLKCTPLHPGGFDPVPARREPRCLRAAS